MGSKGLVAPIALPQRAESYWELASTCILVIIIIMDAFAPSTHLVYETVNDTTSVDYEVDPEGANDKRPQQKRPPAWPTSGPAKGGCDTARACPHRRRQQEHHH